MAALEYGDLVLLWSPKKGDSYLVRLTEGANQSTHLGHMKHDDLVSLSYGDPVSTSTGQEVFSS